jgi:hypothetical protein
LNEQNEEQTGAVDHGRAKTPRGMPCFRLNYAAGVAAAVSGFFSFQVLWM